MFQFLEFRDLQDGEIRLVLKSRDEPDEEKGIMPRYGFSIVRTRDDVEVGVLYFAVDSSRRQYLRGHISYGVSPAHSGHHYAAKACLLASHVARAHGFTRVFIGAKHDNIASIKTIEKLTTRHVTINDVPDAEILGTLNDQQIDMYVWNID